MNSLPDLIKRYSIRHDRKIAAICKPLEEYLKIPVFTYYRIESDGRFSFLSNFPEQSDFYYSEKLYQINPYLTHPKLMRAGAVVLDSTPLTEYQEEDILLSESKFHLHNTFLILEKFGDSVEGFFFGTRKHSPAFANYYLNNLDLLKKFGRHFIQETKPLLQDMLLDEYNLHLAKGAAFLERDITLPLSSKNPKNSQFLKTISPLSAREQECLELFKQGNSAQATAAILCLSRRTVEHYFESIKNKLNCYSKWDLLNQ